MKGMNHVDECNPTIYIQINVPSQLELPKMKGMEHDMDECLNPPYICINVTSQLEPSMNEQNKSCG